MTLSELYTVLSGISGFAGKVAYRAWPVGAAPALPFICYLETGSNNFIADGQVYVAVKAIAVELYTEAKDPTNEALVEAALTGAGIVWSKSEDYLDDERCYMITYTMEV